MNLQEHIDETIHEFTGHSVVDAQFKCLEVDTQLQWFNYDSCRKTMH